MEDISHRNIDAYEIATYCFQNLMRSNIVPYATGGVKFNCFSYHRVDNFTAYIKIDATKPIKGRPNYVSALQDGTQPHNIYGAFGDNFWGSYVNNQGIRVWKPYKNQGNYTEYPTGIGGRFNNMFHPGSTAHKGFIDNIVKDMVRYICNNYNGKVKKV